MKSMTGFGFSEYQDEKIHLSLDLKSYNNRYLDVICNIPPFLNPLEPEIREFITSRVGRGRVEVFVKIREFQEELTIFLDKPVVRSYVEVLTDLAKTAGIDPKINLSHLLKMEGILRTDKRRDTGYYWNLLQNSLKEAYTGFEQSRASEGNRTSGDIRSILGGVVTQVEILELHAAEMEKKIIESLKTRFDQLLGDGYDESRILAETAVMLVKHDINEEIMRIKSHLQNFHAILEAKGPAGKKLDFVCQELGREINTVGSKSVIIDVNHAVVEMKNSVEKIREQLRNVE